MRKTKTLVEQKIERRGCSGKKRFRTQEESERELALIGRSNQAKNYEGVHAYHCQFCGQWHFGHPSEPVKKIEPSEDQKVQLGYSSDPMRQALRKAGLIDG